MRCKNGDMVVVIDGAPEFIGEFHTITAGPVICGGCFRWGWMVDGKGADEAFHDDDLQPIRPPKTSTVEREEERESDHAHA